MNTFTATSTMLEPAGHRLAVIWLGLAEHLWQTALVLLVLFLMGAAMRSAPARHVRFLWTAGLFKLLVPFSLLSLLGRLVPAAVPEPWLHTVKGLLPGAWTHLLSQGGSGIISSFQVVVTPSSLVAADQTGSPLGSWAAIALTMVWVAGVVLGLARLWMDVRGQSGQAGLPLDQAPDPVAARVRAALEGAGIPHGAIRVLQGREVPHTVGFLRPVIRISSRTIEALPEEELRAVLVHEDAHRRRRDPLRALALRILGALLFFYPLVGPLFRRLGIAAELSCDERVVRAGIPARSYARALIRITEQGMGLRLEPFAVGAGGASQLRLRLERLYNDGRLPVMKHHRLIPILAVILIAAGAFLPANGLSPANAVAEDGEFDTPPKPIHMEAADYPEEAKKAGVGGRVDIRITITTKGEVTDLVAVSEVEGHPELTEAAMEALAQWTFEPATKDGKPVQCQVVVPFKFALDEEKAAAPKASAKPAEPGEPAPPAKSAPPAKQEKPGK